METCRYWVAQKRRYCKFKLLNAHDGYCSIHNTAGSGASERIPCPIDGRHLIYKKDLDKHLPKCSRVLEDQFTLNQPLTNQSCNRILCSANDDDDEHAKDVSGDGTYDEIIGELEVSLWRMKLLHGRSEMIRIIQCIHPSFSAPDYDVPCYHERWSTPVERCFTEMTSCDWEHRSTVDKHCLQNASLLELMRSIHLHPDALKPRLYVELGCGKAGLTRWLIYLMKPPDEGIEDGHDKSAQSTEQSVFLLLDCAPLKHKQESRQDVQSKIPSSSIVRLRSNITDVDLTQFLSKKTVADIPSVAGKAGSFECRLSELRAKVAYIQARDHWPLEEVVGVAKHLCGSATDYGIRCLHRVVDSSTVSLVLATCCHHRCEWKQLAGYQYLQQLSVCSSSMEFDRMISMAGWATTRAASISVAKKEVGRLVKQVIDLARICWIAHHFSKVESVQYERYIEDSVTPENFAIIVKSCTTQSPRADC